MKKVKILSLLIFTFMLVFTGSFFVGCGEIDYSDKSLIISVNGSAKSEIVLQVDDEVPIEFKIEKFEKGMDGEVVITPDFVHSECFTLTAPSYRDGVTTVFLKATASGRARIDATTKDGMLKNSIYVTVTEYSGALSNTSKKLFVTNEQPLVPQSTDFVFSDEANVRDLDFYFYGMAANGNQIDLSDLPNIQAGNYYDFVSVQIADYGDVKILIFTDKDGQYWTIANPPRPVDPEENTALPLVSVTKEGDDLVLTSTPFTVKAGDKFTFLAVQHNGEKEVYVARDFYILDQLKSDDLNYTFSYNLYDIDDIEEEKHTGDMYIILTSPFEEPEHGQPDYRGLTLTVEVNSTSKLIKLDYDLKLVEGLKIANVQTLPSEIDGGKTIYKFYLTSDCSTSLDTDFQLSLYYDGFEGVGASVVKNIPLHVIYRPTEIVVNGISSADSEQNVYHFYNQYASYDAGWRLFDVENNGSGITRYEIEFNSNQVIMKDVRGASKEVLEGSGNTVVTIPNLTAPLEFKGNSQLGSGQIQIRLYYQIFDERERVLTYDIFFSVDEGATQLLTDETDFIRKGVYLALGKTETFEAYYANANFADAQIIFDPVDNSDVDCAQIAFQGVREESGKYYMVLSATAKSVGRGRYLLMLDNGVKTNVEFEVIESLDSLSAEVEGQSVTFYSFDQPLEGQASATIYIKNQNDSSGPVFNSQATVFVFADGNRNSTAITEVLPPIPADGFVVTDRFNNGCLQIDISTQTNTVGSLSYTFSGYIIENFRRVEIQLNYTINIISYSEVKKIDVFKTQDAFSSEYPKGQKASQVDVYYNTSELIKKTAKLEVVPQFAGFLFYDPTSGKNFSDLSAYSATAFDKKYISWRLLSNGYVTDSYNQAADQMTYQEGRNNRYTIDEIGYFDTSTLTFEAMTYASIHQLQLVASVRQPGQDFSFVVTIILNEFSQIDSLSLQDVSLKEAPIVFSVTNESWDGTLSRQFGIKVNPQNATDPSISAIVTNPRYDDREVTVFDVNRDVKIEELNNGIFWITLTISEDFLKSEISSADALLSGSIVFASSDWIVGNSVLPEKIDLCISLDFAFANGTKSSPYYLEKPSDILSINKMPTKHFALATTLDISSVKNALPIGGSAGFSGSLVGKNEYAKIEGISISNENNQDEAYFGFFSRLNRTAIVEGVSFAGEIKVELNFGGQAISKYVGIIAGENRGQLINVGVELVADSQVTVSNSSLGSIAYIGGVVGRNIGLIVQDYGEYAETKCTYNSTSGATKISGKYAGQLPRILLYGGINKLSVVGGGNEALYVGGVTGNNSYDYNEPGSIIRQIDYQYFDSQKLTFHSGSIIKIDKNELSSFGYTNYLAYLNIKVSQNMQNYVGMIAGYSNSTIAGIYNVKQDTDNFVCQYYTTDEDADSTEALYSAGKGIVVGGSIIDESLVDKEYASIRFDDVVQYIGGAVGQADRLARYSCFTGITSRVNVLGSKFVGGIAGRISFNNAAGETAPALFMQAVDNKYEGIYAAMVARVNKDAKRFLENVSWYASTKYDDIAFAGSGVNFMSEANVESYVNRKLADNFETNLDGQYYYGDFIVARGFDVDLKGDPLYIEPDEEAETEPEKYACVEFPKGTKSVSVDVNPSGKFARFVDKNGKASNEIFLMYYFRSNGFVGQTEDLATSQNYLDKNYNTLLPGQEFYPVELSGGMILTSLTPNLLTIDHSGKMTILQTGYAKVRISSILDTHQNIDFYLYIVDYFNADQSLSILYPTNSSATEPLTNNKIVLKGEASVSMYVIPSTQTQQLLQHDGATISNDILYDNGAIIRLNRNLDITVDVKIYRQESETEKLVFSNNIFGAEGQSGELNVDISAQSITIKRNNKTVEYDKDTPQTTTYRIEIRPILVANVDKEIFASYVNRGFGKEVDQENGDELADDSFTLTYQKSALKVDLKQNASTQMLVSHTLEQSVFVTSTYTPSQKQEDGKSYMEQDPYYEISKDGTTFYSTYQDIKTDEIFKLKFLAVPEPSRIGDSEYYLYEFPLEITFNMDSSAWNNRHENDIYGVYTIKFYSRTDASKFASMKIELVRTNIANITIDNFTSSTGLTDFSSSSLVAHPGKNSGLLRLTLTPQDCDFDYINIENDALADEAGNGKATFSLVGLNKTAEGGKMKFSQTSIVGQTTARGVRFSMADIVNAYAADNLVDYSGAIYILYNIGTRDVSENGLAKFNIFTQSRGINGGVYQIKLQLELQYHANATLVDKIAYDVDGNGEVWYDVARGMRYQISLDDRWGFDEEDISLSTTDPNVATIVQENGIYYVQITQDPIVYPDEGLSVDVIVTAYQKTGEIERTDNSQTHLRVLEYVVDLDAMAGATNPDIIENVDNGVFNVRVGSKASLRVDFEQFIEYNLDDRSAAAAVQEFYNNISSSGWTLYTNLAAGSSTGRVITTKEGGYDSLEALYDGRELENIYLFVDGTNFVPRMTHIASSPYYLFTYSAKLAKSGGKYAKSSDIGTPIKTEFAINVYQTTSLTSPVPIRTYDELMAMQQGADYILVDDIVIPNSGDDVQTQFHPITTQIASLDGNDYSIIFRGRYDFGNTTTMALFEQIAENTIIKNLTIEVLEDTSFVTSSNEPFDAALLAGANLGTITNCEVIGGQDQYTGQRYSFTGISQNLSNQSYVCGLVVRNNGYITHSRSSVCINALFNASGFVGTNSGHIASSYFKGGKIEVQSTRHSLAGFVISNLSGGTIMTSYVSGLTDETHIYSTDQENILHSSAALAGFVFNNENQAQISDCYSNIQIFGYSSMAGFVYNNAGQIKNCFSLSVLEDSSALSGGFAYSDTVPKQNGRGQFDSCYYFTNTPADRVAGSDGVINGYADVGEINVSLRQLYFDGVSALNRRGFENGSAIDEQSDQNKFSDVFDSYAVYDLSSADEYAGVWFYSGSDSSSKLFGANQFANGRLELVSANIIAKSRRNIAESRTTTQANGEVDYQYDDDLGYPKIGSVENPYVISSAQELETFMAESSTTNGINENHFRLVRDISYSDFGEPSSLYKITYCGTLEGNGMTISNIIMNSAQRTERAGFFGQVGRASHVGVVMNLTVQPMRDITFTNAVTVGGLAGVLNYGYLYNISVLDAASVGSSRLAVTGQNFVGAIVGRAENNYQIFNAYSNMSVVAEYHPQDDRSYEDWPANLAIHSYAGAIAGYASGNGRIENCQVDNVLTVMGGKIGLAFGGLGKNATATDITVLPLQQLSLKAYKYAGFVVGEIKGKLDLVRVQSNGLLAQNYSPFALRPSIPIAVGGVAGQAIGCTISRALVEQNFSTQELATSDSRYTQKIEQVGGVVGLAIQTESSFDQVVMNASIISNTVLGGVVGNSSAAIRLNQVAIKAVDLTVKGYIAEAGFTAQSYLGGFVGNQDSATLTAVDSYTQASLIVDTHVYSSDIETFVGLFLGDGAVNRMERCYASGNINVTLQDKRIADAATPLTVEKVEDEYIYSNKNQRVEVVNRHNAFDNTTSEIKEGSIKDVYFFGTNGDNSGVAENKLKDVVLDRDLKSGAIRFASNVQSTYATLHLTQVGTGTFEIQNFLGTDTIDEVVGPKTLLQNLFDYRQIDKLQKFNTEREAVEDEQIGDRYDTIALDFKDKEMIYLMMQAATRYYLLEEVDGVKYLQLGEDGYYYSDITVEYDGEFYPKYRLNPMDVVAVTNSTRGHVGLSAVWRCAQDGLSTLAFEELFLTWRA